MTCRYFPSAQSESCNLFRSLTHGQSDGLQLPPARSLHLFPQCVPNPLVVGVKQVWDQVWSVSTVGVIIQRTAAPGTLRQMHHPGTNLKRSNISSIPLLVFPLMQYFKSYYLNQGLCFIYAKCFSQFLTGNIFKITHESTRNLKQK